jgi:hypothetical protein
MTTNLRVSGRTRLVDSVPNAPQHVLEPHVRLVDIAKALGCCDRTIRRRRAERLLPEPDFMISARHPRWRVSTIEAWLQNGSKA